MESQCTSCKFYWLICPNRAEKCYDDRTDGRCLKYAPVGEKEDGISDLKPCPFCGSTDIEILGDNYSGFYVGCDTGDCRGNSSLCECQESGYYDSVREAANAWNWRVDTVKHGQYIINDDGDSRCSVCGETYLDCTQNYCPNCGARMDEDGYERNEHGQSYTRLS